MREPPIPSPQTEKKTSNLACPFCGHEFPLTWSRYLKQGFNSAVKCPQCGEKSHLQWTAAYFGYLVLIALISAMITILELGYAIITAPLTDRKGPTKGDAVSLIAILLCIAFPIDRFADARYRPLVKPKNKTPRFG